MSSNTTLVQPPPPLSPTMTVSTQPQPPTTTPQHCQEYQQKEKDKYTVIDLEKNDTLNREEIVIHYPDYDEEATIQAHQHDPYRTTTTSSTKTGNGCFCILTRLRRFRRKHRELLAEFMGTLILVLLVNGVSAEQILDVANKSWFTGACGNGMAVLFAISVCGHISGAHLNPAITLIFWIFGAFPRRKVPVYMAVQMVGAFTGSAILYSIIQPAINQYDGGTRVVLGDHATASIFATYPPVYVGIPTSIASEVVGTALLALLVLTTSHPTNQPFQSMQGCIIAMGVTSIITSIGYTSGFSLNPARDIGPRVFTAVAGWGMEVFTALDYYALVPMLAPFLGAIIGGVVYSIFIDHNHDDDL